MTGRAPIRTALIGAGWMGRFHAESLAERVPGLSLAAIVDPDTATAGPLAERLGGVPLHADPDAVIADPEIAAVVIASPPRFHPDLIIAAARAGKAIFCEKPVALELDELDRALAVVAETGAVLQIGFNRRFSAEFAAAHRAIEDGAVGRPHLMRSLTRDPAPLRPELIKPFAIFLETLIHDFDLLNWYAAPARAGEVNAWADALIRPDFRDRGLVDTAIVTIRFDDGALATAEASLETSYGYDVRAEVFGPGGMLTIGGPHRGMPLLYDGRGMSGATTQLNVELFHDAYVAELATFRDLVHGQLSDDPARVAPPTGADARAALAVATAAITSFTTGTPAPVAE